MRVTIRLKEDRDDDLLNWFYKLGEGERSFYIRQAIRRGLSNTEHPVPLPLSIVQPAKPAKPEPVTAEEVENRLSNLLNNF